MAFTDGIKREVKEKAAFMCCRCRSIGVEVHHIIPQEFGGEDTFENAAPLCPNCHTDFGNNVEKRKEIRHMRDWWYKTVERAFSNPLIKPKELEEINTKLEAIKNSTDSLDDLKGMLKDLSNRTIDNITAGTAAVTASGVVNTSTASITATKLGENVYANVKCRYCNSYIGLLVGTNACPSCGMPIS